MKRIKNIAIFITILFITGCGESNKDIVNHLESNKVSKEVDIKEEETKPSDIPIAPIDTIEKEDDGKILKLGEKVKDPFVAEGDFYYIVERCDIYDDITQLDLKKAFVYPDTFLHSNELREQYMEMSAYITEAGELTTGTKFLLLDLYMKNESAVGWMKKNEFIMSMDMIGGDPVNRYGITYFSEAGELYDENQILYFELEQGQEKRVQIGYFVLEEDLEKGELVGKMNETQFEVY